MGMGSFKGRVLIFGLLFALLVIILTSYSVYKLDKMNRLVDDNVEFYLPVARSVATVENLFLAYCFDMNKIVSDPARYTVSEIDNSPLGKKVDAAIEELGSEDVTQSFKSYNRSVLAIVEAFSSEGNKGNLRFINVKHFMDIMKSSETSIFLNLETLARDIDDRVISQKANVRFFLLAICCLSMFAAILAIIYSRRISNFIERVTAAIMSIKSERFSPDKVSESIPHVNEDEFFELSDKVTRLATVISEKINKFRSDISDLENDDAKHKLIATYTTSILDSLNVGIMVTDNLLRVSFVNREFERFWKINRNHIVDVEIQELPLMRIIKGWKKALDKVLVTSDKDSPPVFFNSDYKLSGSTVRNVMFSVMPLRDQVGNDILGTVTLTRGADGRAKKRGSK